MVLNPLLSSTLLTMTHENDEEELVEAFSTHWIKYVLPTVFFVLLSGTSLLLFFLSTETLNGRILFPMMLYFSALVLLLTIHHWFFHRIMSEGMVDIIFTSKRIIYFRDSLFFCEDMHELTLKTIRAVEAQERGILQNILRYGNLWFDTGGSDIAEKGRILSLVPHPHRKAKSIMKLLKMK
jgi:hypothetical protein